MENVKCLKCGERKGRCGYVGNIGMIDHIDMYMLSCRACGHEESSTVSANWRTDCPYCCKGRIGHEKRVKKAGINKVEFFEDALRVHYHLQKPWGESDVDGVVDVRYESFYTLPELPDRIGLGVTWREEILVPKLGGKIIFIFDSYQERSGGPNEHNICGPYRGK